MQEVSLMPWWWPIFVNLWSFAGPLVGIFVGAYLTRRWQREQRIADNKTQEFKNLLMALTSLNNKVVKEGGIPNDPDDSAEAENLVMVSETCLYISDFLAKSRVIGNLLDALKILEADRNLSAFLVKYHKITNIIRTAAKEAG
jgi:hypothetical protein